MNSPTIARARTAADTAELIRSQPELQAAAAHWEQRAVIALDTEFVRERTFYAKPGLVQLSDGETVWLLDPLQIADLTPLADLLSNPGITKILHSAGEDLEVLKQMTGALPDPLFDTQVAAALTGRPLQMAYEKLVEDVLDVSLPGGKARSNWLQRPLPPELLEYSANDVAYLPAVAAKLQEALQARGRLEWLHEDCARTLEAARTPTPPEQAWLRVKGSGVLDRLGCFRLKTLATWREHQAEQKDLPRGFIIKDDVLVEIARRAPSSREELADTPGLPRPVLRRDGEHLLSLLASEVPDDFQCPPALEKLSPGQRDALRQMQQKARLIAEKLDVEAALLASKRELTRWLQEGPPGWLDGWRGQFLDGDFARI